MPIYLSNVLAISVIVIPFIILIIWVIRKDRDEVQNRHQLMDSLAMAFHVDKQPDAFSIRFNLLETTYDVGIGHGGENDPDMLYVSRDIDPLPDGIHFIFEQGINRWLSRKLNTGDHDFDCSISYQIKTYQKRSEIHEFVKRLCDDANVRAALLRICATDYLNVFLSGAYKQGSRLDKVTKSFTNTNRLLMAYAKHPKPVHYEPERIRIIAEALAVIAKKINSDELGGLINT